MYHIDSMKMLTATAFRKNLYELLKHIEEKPIFFTYKGEKYSVVPAMEAAHLSLLKNNTPKMTRDEIVAMIRKGRDYASGD